jgi:hypothetical protein
MKIETIFCDRCDKNSNNGEKIVSYDIYAKKGTKGYLIEYARLDMCHGCWKKYIKENKDTKEVFPLASWW